MPINQQTAQDAYTAVLAHAGCSKPNRDSVDARIVQEVATGTTTYGNNGIITTPADVGGWPTLASGTPPTDTDHDGMPDDWENTHGLNPNDPSDRNLVGPNGYTMLENYLNELGAF
jgi:pectate lyase